MHTPRFYTKRGTKAVDFIQNISAKLANDLWNIVELIHVYLHMHNKYRLQVLQFPALDKPRIYRSSSAWDLYLSHVWCSMLMMMMMMTPMFEWSASNPPLVSSTCIYYMHIKRSNPMNSEEHILTVDIYKYTSFCTYLHYPQLMF